MIWRSAFFISVTLFCVAQAPNAAPQNTPPSPLPKADARTVEFSMPFSFDFSRDFNVLLPLEFDYDLTKEAGATLMLGPVALNQTQFNFTLGRLSKLYPGLEDVEVLLIRWPEQLFKRGSLEMISRGGRVLWKYEIADSDLADWKAKIAGKKSDRVSTLGILDPSLKGAPFSSVDEPFRFCLSQGQSDKLTRLCSDQHISQKTKEGLRLARQTVKTPLRVLLQNQAAPTKKVVVVDRKKRIQFYADLTSGISYEFVTMPPKANITDISTTSIAKLYRVSGWDVFPLSPYKTVKEEVYPDWVKKFNFYPTILDERKFWEAGVRAESPVLYFPGDGGGVFRQKMNLANIPPAEARAYLRGGTTKATYWDSVPIFGHRTPNVKVESKEFSVDLADAKAPDPNLFVWNFKATEKGEMNQSHITFTHNGKSYLGYYDIYRSFANELSGRFTGVYSDGSILLLTELAYNFWLESIFGNTNRWLSFQRWGLSVKYFKSLTPLPVDANGQKGNLDVSVFDFKYRLTPGVWTRDETVGMIASYQTFKFEDLKSAMAGVGAFWARSMPTVFDTWFNKFPYMNYPKWVDMEFIMYLQPLTANVSLGLSYSLNFHGQVLWSRTLFGEAGFGLKRYEFTDNIRQERAALNTLYGTLGLGIKF